MIKRKIMMRVTPEQSKQVQEICFANSYFWGDGLDRVAYTDSKGLLLSVYGLRCISEGLFNQEPFLSKYKEVDASFFIKTNGTCIEETPEQPTKSKPKQYLVFASTKGKPKHISTKV